MDPYLANLNFDPPRRSSELAWGLLPALLLNVAFFGVALLGSNSGDVDAGGKDMPSLTREMGGPAAPSQGTASPEPTAAPAITVDPAPVRPTPTRPAAPVNEAPPMDASRATTSSIKTTPIATTPAPTVVARADPQAGSPRVDKSVARPAPAATTPRVSPSFDCNRASLRTDKLICSDAELSQLDHDLGRLYAQAKAATPDPSGFRRTNDREWKRREAECRDKGKDCLRQWYVERRAQLQASLEGRRQATGSATR